MNNKTKDLIDDMTLQSMQGDILDALDGITVKAVGLTMLAKVNNGKTYRLERSSTKVCKAVTFYPSRGKNPIVTHCAWSVLRSIQGRANGYLNGFDVI